jgi:hypothetical protein
MTEKQGYRFCLECQERAEKAESECAALRFELTSKNNEVEIADGEIERLRAEVDERRKIDLQNCKLIDSLRAEVERLRDTNLMQHGQLQESRSRLAAATELLRRAHDTLARLGLQWVDAPVPLIGDVRAFLAAQPATPAIRCHVCGSDEPMAVHRCRHVTPDVRTVRVSSEGMGTPQRFTMTVQPATPAAIELELTGSKNSPLPDSFARCPLCEGSGSDIYPGQPAAPARTEVDVPHWVRTDLFCTEAEQRVLEACAAMKLGDDDPGADPLEPQEVGEDCYIYTDDQCSIARAELARREASK